MKLPAVALVALCMGAVISLSGCGGGDDSGDDASTEWWGAQFGAVMSGQGVASAAPYTPGGTVKILPLKLLNRTYTGSGNPQLAWAAGVEVPGLYNLIPGEHIATTASEVQLVMIAEYTETKRTDVLYSPMGYFYHTTCHAELREAATGRLVAAGDFAGNNVAPATISSSGNSMIPRGDDSATMLPAIIAWLGLYW